VQKTSKKTLNAHRVGLVNNSGFEPGQST